MIKAENKDHSLFFAAINILKIAALISTLLFLSFTTTDSAVLRMEVRNLMQSEHSFIRVAIFENEDQFPDHPVRSLSIPVQELEKQSIEITDLPIGSYFIAVYQDLDENEELNKNWIGIPSEPYGFSNNIKPSITGLQLEKSKFSFPQTKVLEIELR